MGIPICAAGHPRLVAATLGPAGRVTNSPTVLAGAVASTHLDRTLRLALRAWQAYNSAMTRTLRIGLAAGALILLVVGGVLAAPSERGRDRMAPVAASHQPASPGQVETQDEDENEDGTPSQEVLDRVVGRLADAGITTDAETVAGLAADHGVGGAVRLLAWADASGMSTAELADMFASGMGWGQIAAELDLHPGIGSIMGNAGGNGNGLGLGRANAPGQQKQQ